MSSLTNIQQDALEGFRLSPQQQRVWLAQRADGERVYCARCEFAIEGELDVGRLARALQRLVRHEILRTAFRSISGMTVPLQLVCDHPVNFDCIDLRDRSEAAQTSAKARVFEAHASGFDFNQGKPLRASLLALGPQRHALLISLPALCGDAATLANLFNALVFEFDADGADTGDGGEAPVQYAQFSEWRNKLLETDDDNSRSALAYWVAQNPASPPTKLPFERASRAPFTSEACAVELRGDAAARIEAFAIEHQSSAETLLFACWQTLLWRLTGDDEVIVQRVFDGRQYDKFKPAFGLFAQSLPTRFSFASDPSFGELARGLAATLEAMAEHQQYFVPERCAKVDFRQSLAFEFFELPRRRRVGGVSWSMLKQHVCAEPFKLKLNCMRRENDVRAAIDFDPEIFDREDIERIARCFATLLDSALANPGVAASRLEILDAADLRHVVTELNETTVHFRSEKCIHELFEERAVRAPNSIALVCDDRQLSYAELNARSNQLANYLLNRGVVPEVPVGVCLERTSEMVIAIMAILKAGGAYVALDPSYPSQRLADMVEDSQPALLLTQPGLCGKLPSVSDDRLVLLEGVWSAIAGGPAQNPAMHADPARLAYIIYTSGSTGKPKGVMVTHANLSHYAHALVPALDLCADDRYLHTASFSFSSSVRQLMLPLASGAAVVLATRNQIDDPRLLFELVRRADVTVMDLVPSYWRVCIQALEDLAPQARSTLLRNKLRLIASASEPLSSVLPNRWSNLQSDVHLINMFGQTETTGIVATYPIGIEPQARKIVAIGRPIANTQAYILDAYMRPVPLGVAGELYIGGNGVGRGYLGQEQLTAEKFVANPFSSHGMRLYRTGDQARYLPDGNIEFLGRIDTQVKIRGHRVEIGEIEAALLNLNGIREAVVVARADRDGENCLVAYVHWTNLPAALTSSELRDLLKARLPDYMVPSVFVSLDAMPLTPNGKIDRQALPALGNTRADSGVAYVAPRTPTEQTLAVIWAEVLKLDQVGIHDNFFELGGHSLLATQIVSRIHQSFSIELPSQALFESQTVATLARRIDALPGADGSRQAPPIVPVSRDGVLPLSFSQLRLWFFDQLQPRSAVYNIPRAVRMTGRLDVESLRKALNSVVDRHESLRTCFSISADGEPQQLIAARLELALPVIDLRGLPHSEREAEAQRLIIEDGRRPFALAHGPLLRASLLRLGDEDHVFLLTYHHICGDNWSAGILFAELAAFYRAHREDTPASLPPLSIQYADFAHWQRRWLQGDALEQQLAYWKGQLSGAPEVLELPIDRPRPAVYSHAGNWQAFSAPSDLMRALMELSRSESASLFMTMLAAYQILLSQFAAQNDVLVGAPIAGRNRAETEGLIGVFINTLVLRTDCLPGRSIRELLREVRESTLAAYAHQDLPFDLLVSELRLKRRPDQTVLVQASFNWQNIRMPMPKLPGLTLRPVDDKASDHPGSGDSFEAEHLRAFLSNNQTVRFDLVLSMWMQGEELRGRLEYNSDIFEPRTIEELIAHYKILLEAIATDPDRRLADLPLLTRRHNQRSGVESVSDDSERKGQTMKDDHASKKNKFMAIKPKAVSTSRLVKAAYLPPDAALPLIIEPDLDDVDLIEWAKFNRPVLDAEILKYGALLFRGFRLRSALEFERFIRAISNDLIEYSYRSTPRTRVEGKIYTSTEYPADQSIPLHNEMSYSRNWPMKIWFFSVQTATQGGETPIADSRRVYERLDPKIRQRFSERKVMYVRNYGGGVDLGWQDVFQTSDKAELEAFCARASMTLEWMDSDRLCTRQVCQAVAEHPRTKEWVWFNQAHLFHVSSLRSEARECLVEQFGETNLPRNAYYGDGSPIEDSILDEIRGVYAEVEAAFPWRESDILMLDNMLVAHGRRPFSGPRKVLVGMAEAFGMGEGAI